MRKLNTIPYFLNTERTPLVDQLFEIVKERDDYIRDLEDEVKRLKKLPAKPEFGKRTSGGEKKKSPSDKRPGSAKAKKIAELPVREIHILKVENKPKDAKFPALFAAGCFSSSYLQADDTGARH